MSKMISTKATDEPEIEQLQPLIPVSIIQAEDPGIDKTEVPLKPDEVLLVSLDLNGNESGIPFIVNTKTYQTYYGDDTKFRLKKTSQQ